MDYEKEYQNALERAKKGLPLDEVFPELKESEDERIRKEIHAYLFNTLHNTQQLTPRTNELELWLAYLEKQKEKKLAESAALQKAFISSKTDYILEEKCDASDYADAILPTSVADGENEEEYKLHKIIEAAFIAGRKKEQQPAGWSEEDENAFLFLYVLIDSGFTEKFINAQKASDMKKWLNTRFKSIRPPHWKPSEEQMAALKKAQYMMSQSGDYYDTTAIINSLITDLQKLL